MYFSQLTEEQQKKAVNYCTTRWLTEIIEGCPWPGHQAAIDKAIQKANDNQTPWFAGECIMEAIGEKIVDEATEHAHMAVYLDGFIIPLSAIN